MADVRKYSGTLVTDSGGDGTLTLPSENGVNITGALVTIRHIDGGGSNYDDAFTFTVTGAGSGRTLYTEEITTTANFERNPDAPTHAIADGTAGTAGGIVFVENDRLTITVSSGGNAKTGDWELIIA